MTTAKRRKNIPENSVRIIGGKWRGRRLHFPDQTDLRPTPDRVRETVFNWLGPSLHGAHCLDAFAGSGALGFEALSRGAAQATFVECSKAAFASLTANREKLHAENAQLICAHFPNFAAHPFSQRFDIVFLDPPFGQNLIEPACQFLVDQNHLNPNALIYLETESSLSQLPIPKHWEILRSKTAGAVNYCLVRAL